MKKLYLERPSERGGAAVKFLAIAIVLVLIANAGYNYVPIAYAGASFQQEMDTAVVKGLAAPGQLKPADVVKAHIQRAAQDYEIPADAVIEIKPNAGAIQAHVTYTKPVNMLPFGLYKYNYQFNHVAAPVGYLTKQ
ncbi:MAG: hypothetical protein ACJ72Z_03945 [Pyrinomonadaceae bacterium]